MTCSKDSRVLFWGILGSKHEVQLKATVDMKKEQVVYNIIIFHLKVDMIFSQNWIHTWGGRFNKTDTLLLVAGVLDQVTSPPILKLPISLWVLIGSLFIFQGPYFHYFGFIHAKNVNPVSYLQALVSVCTLGKF